MVTFMIHNFLFMFFLHWLVKIQCNLSVAKMYPAVLKSCAVANTSAHWMPLLFFLTLYGAWWALPSVYVVYFCCMDLYYYYKRTRKKTRIPHILIFNKEYSVFPNLQCASCWFPFIVLLLLPCPYLPPSPSLSSIPSHQPPLPLWQR